MKYIILGAGPAGLTIANKLHQMGEDDFVVLEKEKQAGGLCRSIDVDGYAFDTGGGHFLDIRRPYVNDFLFQFMPREEWNLFDRDSRIVINEVEIAHPIEANIWQMTLEYQVEYIKSIAKAGCTLEEPMPKEFINWIYWKLGDKIAEDYMIPYNQKMFNKELNELGTYWLEKLPSVSFDETLFSCLEHKPYGTQPGHAQFYYPKKYGYGELWTRMADVISKRIKYNNNINVLDINRHSVTTVQGIEYQADKIIVTIPWTCFEAIKGMPQELFTKIKKLRYSSVETRYYNKTLDTKAHWIYYPNRKLAYHRILVRSNFCTDSCGYWTETNSQRVNMIPLDERENFSYMNEYAYPLNTIDKPEIMQELLTWANEREIIGLGRWGEWEHYNSDVVVERALNLAKNL